MLKWFYIVLLLLAFSCKKKSDYPGYTKSPPGLYYKLLIPGDGNKTPQPSDEVEVSIKGLIAKDYVLFSSPFFLYKVSENTLISKAIGILNEGDSASFILKADSGFARTFHTDYFDSLTLGIKLLKILPKNSQDEPDIEEQRTLQRYLASAKNNYKLMPQGYYFSLLKITNGIEPVEGDEILIQYEGNFLNGESFDTGFKKNEMELTLGQPDQVIPGIEKAIYLMREGESAKIILPSQLAFGEGGSSTGIIPPYTSVIYKITLLKINKNSLNNS